MEHIPKPNEIEVLKQTIGKLVSLSFEDRANLALVVQGKKPASILEFQFPVHEESGRDDIQYDISLIEQTLDTLCIPYEKRETSDNEHMFIEICVGKDQEHLHALLDAGSDPRPLGRALGYPDTAADAHAMGGCIDLASLPKEVRDDDAMAFLNFRLSRGHWQEELKEVKKRAEVIRMTTPELYEKIVALNKK